MTTYDLIIRNGTVLLPNGPVVADLAVSGGLIARIGTELAATAHDEVDATGRVVSPGGIDTHTHVRWPHDDTFTTDDFLSATRAAALGGTTTIVDFVPPGEGSLRQRCHDRMDEARGVAVTDFAFHPILTSDSDRVLGELDAVVGDGFMSFKMYTTYEDRRVDDGAAWYLMRAIAEHGGLPGFHAENHELIEHTLDHQQRAGTTTMRDYPDSRPGLAEAESIQMVSLFAKRIRTPVYIFHVSGSEALGAIREARAEGTDVVAETCTHYLTLDQGVFERPDAWKYVISPPLRGDEDREDLWRALADGTIRAVGSDHCAYHASAKRAEVDDHRAIPAGAPGIEARTPLLFAETVRRFGVHRFAELSAARAAETLNLPTKGSIEVGKDADLVVWDADATWRADDAERSSSTSFTLYDGMESTGRPVHVFVRGHAVVRDTSFVAEAGSGSYVHRPRLSRARASTARTAHLARR